MTIDWQKGFTYGTKPIKPTTGLVTVKECLKRLVSDLWGGDGKESNVSKRADQIC